MNIKLDLPETANNRIARLLLLPAVTTDAAKSSLVFPELPSDLHIEALTSGPRIRYRVLGEMHCIDTTSLTTPVIKTWIEAITPSRDSDCRGRIEFEGKFLEFRLVICSSKGGTHYTFRFLHAYKEFAYHLHPEVQAIIDSTLQRKQGLTVITGPIGSGKSMFMSYLLKSMDRKKNTIFSIEDPVEQVVPDVVQLSVNQASDRTFENILRSVLRCDPDVIMIGELRDREIAQMAIQAATTGHFILSTLHTNSALQVSTRLEDLSASPALINESLITTFAIRLVRHRNGRERVAIISAYTQLNGQWKGISLHEAAEFAISAGLVDPIDVAHISDKMSIGESGTGKSFLANSLMEKIEANSTKAVLPKGLQAALDHALDERKDSQRLHTWIPALKAYYEQGISIEQILIAVQAEGIKIDKEDLLKKLM